MKKIMEISGAEFERAIQSTAEPVLVHFYTSWSDQCQLLAPSLEALAGEFKNELKIAQVNLDYHPELAARYDVTKVPTLILFENGVPIECVVGRQPLRELRARLEGVLADYTMLNNH